MGAIMGGLYAAGWSAVELDSILRIKDIAALMQDNVSRDRLSFFEKENQERYALSLSVEDFSVNIPPALSNGQQIYELLHSMTRNIPEMASFNDLPRPFLCIATDLVSGEEVIIRKGSLPDAMNASGALPALLAPVEIEGRLLADGGLVNNFPVKEVLDQGMDYIIGVEFGSQYAYQRGVRICDFPYYPY